MLCQLATLLNSVLSINSAMSSVKSDMFCVKYQRCHGLCQVSSVQCVASSVKSDVWCVKCQQGQVLCEMKKNEKSDVGCV